MDVNCVLWEFGNTLADQDWLHKAPEDYPQWPQAWNTAARGEIETLWFRNEIDCSEVAERISILPGMPCLLTTSNPVSGTGRKRVALFTCSADRTVSTGTWNHRCLHLPNKSAQGFR